MARTRRSCNRSPTAWRCAWPSCTCCAVSPRARGEAMTVTSWGFLGCVGLLVLLLATVLATFLILHFARRRPRTLRAAAPPLQVRAAASPAPMRPGTTGPVRSVGLPGTVDYQPSPSGPAGAFPVQVGRYRILGLLGAGGMGTVYRAH